MYKLDVLIQGYPGKSLCHGGLGWSTIALLRGGGRSILVDVGAFALWSDFIRAERIEPNHPNAQPKQPLRSLGVQIGMVAVISLRPVTRPPRAH